MEFFKSILRWIRGGPWVEVPEPGYAITMTPKEIEKRYGQHDPCDDARGPLKRV